MKLVIVESPAKSKTISKYLGNDFKVVASVGHVRDLPKSNKKAVDIEGGFIPHYEIAKGKDLSQLVRAGSLFCPSPNRIGTGLVGSLNRPGGINRPVNQQGRSRIFPLAFDGSREGVVASGRGFSLCRLDHDGV